MVDSPHGIIPLIPRASYLISARLPYLYIVEFYSINVQAVLCSVRSYMAVDNRKSTLLLQASMAMREL